MTEHYILMLKSMAALKRKLRVYITEYSMKNTFQTEFFNPLSSSL